MKDSLRHKVLMKNVINTVYVPKRISNAVNYWIRFYHGGSLGGLGSYFGPRWLQLLPIWMAIIIGINNVYIYKDSVLSLYLNFWENFRMARQTRPY